MLIKKGGVSGRKNMHSGTDYHFIVLGSRFFYLFELKNIR